MRCNTRNSAIQKPRYHDERLSTVWRYAPAPPWRGQAPRWPRHPGRPSSRPGGAAVDDHQPAARFQSARRPDHLFLGPRHHRGRPILQRPRPAQHGDQAPPHRGVVGRRPGLERAGPLPRCGATFPTTGRCDGRRTTVTSASSARRPTTPTATRSISRAASSPANISPAAWCAMSTTAPRPCWPTISAARSSTRPTTSSPIPTAATGSPIRPMAGSSMRVSLTSRAVRAIPAASSIRGSGSRPASCRASANCRPIAIASIRPAASTSW